MSWARPAIRRACSRGGKCCRNDTARGSRSALRRPAERVRRSAHLARHARGCPRTRSAAARARRTARALGATDDPAPASRIDAPTMRYPRGRTPTVRSPDSEPNALLDARQEQLTTTGATMTHHSSQARRKTLRHEAIIALVLLLFPSHVFGQVLRDPPTPYHFLRYDDVPAD